MGSARGKLLWKLSLCAFLWVLWEETKKIREALRESALVLMLVNRVRYAVVSWAFVSPLFQGIPFALTLKIGGLLPSVLIQSHRRVSFSLNLR